MNETKKLSKVHYILIGVLMLIAMIFNQVFGISLKLISFILFAIAFVATAIYFYIFLISSKDKFESKEKIETEFNNSLSTIERKDNESFIDFIKNDPVRKLIYPGFAAFFIAKGGEIIGISGIPILNLGEGFSGTANIFNALITFFPIFFVLFNFKSLKERFSKKPL